MAIDSNRDARQQDNYGGVAAAVGIGGAAAVALAIMSKGKSVGKAAKAVDTPAKKSVDDMLNNQHVVDSIVKQAKQGREAVNAASDVVVPNNVVKQAHDNERDSIVSRINGRNSIKSRVRETMDAEILPDPRVDPTSFKQEVTVHINNQKDATNSKIHGYKHKMDELQSLHSHDTNVNFDELSNAVQSSARDLHKRNADSFKKNVTPNTGKSIVDDLKKDADISFGVTGEMADSHWNTYMDSIKGMSNPWEPKAKATTQYDHPIGPEPKQRMSKEKMQEEIDKDFAQRNKPKTDLDIKMETMYKNHVETDPETGVQKYFDDQLFVDSLPKPGKEFQDNVYSHGFSAFGASKWIADEDDMIVNGLTNMKQMFANKDTAQISVSDAGENIGHFGAYVKGDVHANFKNDVNSMKDPTGDNRRLIVDAYTDDMATDFGKFKEQSAKWDNFDQTKSKWTESIVTPNQPVGLWYKEDSMIKDMHLDFMKETADQHNIPITKIGKKGNEVVYTPQTKKVGDTTLTQDDHNPNVFTGQL